MENSKVIFLYCGKQPAEISHLQGDQIPSQLMIAFVRIKLTLDVLFVPGNKLDLSFPSG